MTLLHLKTFESVVLDDILDKKSAGKELTNLEQEYLDNYSDYHKRKHLETEIENKNQSKSNRIKRSKEIFEYDPRDDQEFYDKLGDKVGIPINFSKWDDEMIDAGRYEIFYDDIEESEIEEFIQDKNISKDEMMKEYEGENVFKPWHELSDEIQNKFKEWVDDLRNE
jgi:hypothetical protein